MTVTPDEDSGDIGVINVARAEAAPFMAHTLSADLDSGELIINLRAEADPDMLSEAVGAALREVTTAENELTATFEHSEHFRPAKPTPTYRMAEV
jgi:hypothetical protein